MISMRKLWLPRLHRSLPVPILAAMLAAGCAAGAGGQPGATPVASLPGHAGRAAAPGKLTTAQGDQDMIRFTRCMRGHGVPMADPSHRPGHSGLTIDIPTLTPAVRAAYQACVHFIQPIIDLKQAGAASAAAPQLAALTGYARCMRGHDIAMLDPTPDGALNLGQVPGISGNFGRYSPQFRAADAACRHLLPPGVHDDGSGP